MRNLIVILSILLSFVAKAQIQTDNSAPYNSPNHLVEEVLLGNGVTAFNIQFNGDPVQMGFFNGTTSNLGLDSGVVLATDYIQTVEPGGTGTAPTNTLNDPDLLTVANSVPPLIGQTFSVSDVNDVAILEFDFIPSSDTVKFNYVFGSDEYTTYINSSYNDVFAFFISGPGINGPYQSPAAFPNGAQNIAVVPNSTPPLPITISSVQPALNGQYYVDNMSGTTLDLNGITKVFTAESPVQCGETYHIKLAIADGSDAALASAVFLEANSFSSSSVELIADPSYNTNLGDSVLYEGCGDVTLHMIRHSGTTTVDTVFIQTSGNSTEGSDYSAIPDTVYFPIGIDSIQVQFSAIHDAITEGYEDLIIEVNTKTACGSVVSKSIALTLHDADSLKTYGGNVSMNCSSDSIRIEAGILSGLPEYEYNWSSGFSETTLDSSSSIMVRPNLNETYFVTITDGCGVYSFVDSIEVNVLDEPMYFSGRDTFIVCKGESIFMEAFAHGGVAPHNYWWENNPAHTGLTQNVTPDSTTSYTLFGVDRCPYDTAEITLTVYVPEYDPIEIQLSESLFEMDCPGKPVNVYPTAIGGSGGYTFTWDDFNTTDTALYVNPLESEEYILQVTDYCGTDTISDTVEVRVQQDAPLMLLTADTLTGCANDEFKLSAVPKGGAGNYFLDWELFVTDDTVQYVRVQETTTYSAYLKDGCGTWDTAHIVVDIHEPIADFRTHHYDLVEVEFENVSSDDVTRYQWNFGDGSTSFERSPIYTYAGGGSYDVLLTVFNNYGCIDTAEMTLESPTAVWVPSAFTPNGDGINDTWGIESVGFNKFEIALVNRWGETVFTSNDPSFTWDGLFKGKPVPQGQYLYTIHAVGFDTKEIAQNGTVLVLP